MDSGRAFRAVVTCLTLLACLWLLNSLTSRSKTQRLVSPPADSLQTAKPTESHADLVPPPSVRIESLPLVAMDNSCLYGAAADIPAARVWFPEVLPGPIHFQSLEAELWL